MSDAERRERDGRILRRASVLLCRSAGRAEAWAALAELAGSTESAELLRAEASFTRRVEEQVRALAMEWEEKPDEYRGARQRRRRTGSGRLGD